MRLHHLGFAAALAAGSLFLSAPSAHAQTVITGFNFNGSTPGTPGVTQLTSTQGQATSITTNFDRAFVTNFGGSTINAQNGDVAGQALALQGGTNNAQNGNYIQFAVSTVGFNNLALNFATQRTGTGFNANVISYSLTGVNGSFTNFTTYNPATSFALQTTDFSSVTGLNNNANVVLRIVFNGATSQAGNNRIDNLTLSGNAVAPTAAPEPGTLGLALAALPAALGGIAIRRRKSKARA